MKCYKVFFAVIVFVSLLTQSIIGKNNENVEEVDKIGNNLLSIRYEFSQYNNLNPIEEFNKEQVSRKSPWLAFFLSLFLPTTGQIYNGDYTKAAIQAGMVLGGVGLVSLTGCTECGQPGELQTAAFLTGLGLTFVGYIWSIFDALISANNINAELKYQNKSQVPNNRSEIFTKNQNLYFSSDNLISIKINF